MMTITTAGVHASAHGALGRAQDELHDAMAAEGYERITAISHHVALTSERRVTIMRRPFEVPMCVATVIAAVE